MSSQPEERPYSDSHLDSPEYRKRLLRKLNTLIAVLEVACAKVRRSLTGPDADVERLLRIQKNLKDTLQVCLRAKKALNEMQPGQVLKIVATDPGSVKDFQAFSKQTGNELLSHAAQQKEFVFFMKRR